MAKVSLLARLVAKEGKRDEVMELLGRIARHAEGNEPGTELYCLNVSAQDDVTLWVHELYADQAAFEAHAGSQVFAEAAGQFGPLLEETEMILGRPTGGKGFEV
jgi:quinol monooxygenase YgiN